MNNIFIDDLRNPPTTLTNVVVLRSSQEALTYLQDNPNIHFGEVWFDHDLGGDDTTIPVVDYLCQLAFNGSPLIVEGFVVHSANPVGVRTITAALNRYYPSVRVSRYSFS